MELEKENHREKHKGSAHICQREKNNVFEIMYCARISQNWLSVDMGPITSSIKLTPYFTIRTRRCGNACCYRAWAMCYNWPANFKGECLESLWSKV